MIKVEVLSGPLQHQLQKMRLRMTAGTPQMTRLIKATAGFMMEEVEENFEAEGRPDKWKELSPVTIMLRAAKNRWPGKIMQMEGHLADSISSHTTRAGAQVGTNLKYAAIHHFGGRAGRGLKVTIPARPVLLLTDGGVKRIITHAEKYYME